MMKLHCTAIFVLNSDLTSETGKWVGRCRINEDLELRKIHENVYRLIETGENFEI